MESYFYEIKNGTKVLKESLLTTEAEKWAKSFIWPSQPGPAEKGVKNPPLGLTQFRRFFNEARSLESKVQVLGFEKMRPLVKMIKSKIALACPKSGRDRKVPMEFKNYVDKMIDSIQTKEDFDGFMKCFEAVLGFYIGEGGRDYGK